MTTVPTPSTSERAEAARDQSAVTAVACDLWDAEATGVPVPPVRTRLPARDLAAAYEVQAVNIGRAVASGRRVIGRKVGLTSVAVQRQLGVDQPDHGALFADRCFAAGEEVPRSLVLQPKVEAEIALVLGRDLPDPDTTPVELVRAVDHLLPALEIVGSRITGWDIDIVDTIADNASSGAVVVGFDPVTPGTSDLAAAAMTLTVAGDVRSVGTGADCLGHPYRAALWLARTMARLGAPLRCGDLVMTGALGPMATFDGSATVTASITGIGQVSATLVEDRP